MSKSSTIQKSAIELEYPEITSLEEKFVNNFGQELILYVRPNFITDPETKRGFEIVCHQLYSGMPATLLGNFLATADITTIKQYFRHCKDRAMDIEFNKISESLDEKDENNKDNKVTLSSEQVNEQMKKVSDYYIKYHEYDQTETLIENLDQAMNFFEWSNTLGIGDNTKSEARKKITELKAILRNAKDDVVQSRFNYQSDFKEQLEKIVIIIPANK